MPLIAEGHNLFVIDLTYTKPFEEIEKILEPHLAFVTECYAKGAFLFSGAKEPRTGGVIIAAGASKDEIRALMAQDPFCVHDVVALEITEFKASNMAEALKAL
ncbi:MAG: YciI family protein [Pelagimonas sp.]|jgi:uncharacterized protein YciI|nr:YciI family protein [Pelagimonas sp.]